MDGIVEGNIILMNKYDYNIIIMIMIMVIINII